MASRSSPLSRAIDALVRRYLPAAPGRRGGFPRLDRVFGGRLAGLLGDINEAAWKDTA